MPRAIGFLAPPQVNPSGYTGSGKGLTPLPSVVPTSWTNPGTPTNTTNLPNQPAGTPPSAVETLTPAPLPGAGGYGSQPLQPAPGQTVAPTNTAPVSHPFFPSLLSELGVGIARIKELGVLGVRL